MPEITELVLATLDQAQRRVEIASQNLANATTPAYKRKVAFTALVRNDQAGTDVPRVNINVDNRPGKLIVSGKPTDFAILGDGYFAFRGEGGTVYSRRAQLTASADGRLLNEDGLALQLANGNDVIVRSSSFEVKSDGSVIDKGEGLGRIGVFGTTSDAGAGSAALGNRASTAEFVLLPDAAVRQGAIEASNVTSGDEMVAMIEALRRAESGQRIMTTYDELMGRVITSFGEATR